jgi:REP element-mobilizing transposase RayT
MPRQPRLDAPGTLHHVMGRGIEAGKIFRTKKDREDFLDRLAQLCRTGGWALYAWALVPNHFHLLVRTGKEPLAGSMRRLMTGYAINFNLRHKRRGHLFQNRYKSIVCQEDLYLLELTRYIHLNPFRAGLVHDLEALGRYPWSGHSALLGQVERDWQDTGAILGYFSRKHRESVRRYKAFVAEGVDQGRRPELVGGGLIRSLGGWSQVLSLRRKGLRMAADDRVLGDGDFVEQIWSESTEREKETLRRKGPGPDLKTLAREIAAVRGITETELRSGSRMRRVSEARRVFCKSSVAELGYPAAAVARFLGVTTSAVVRAARAE